MEEEYCWTITQVVGGHAVADQVLVCFELSGFKLAFLVHIKVDHMYTCILILDLGKIRLALSLNKSVRWSGRVHVRQFSNPTYYICIYYIL
jgi:hypothetical protein